MRAKRYQMRVAALAAAVCVCGACCVHLAAGGQQLATDAGLLGFTFFSAPAAAGQTLAAWLTGQGADSSAQNVLAGDSSVQQNASGGGQSLLTVPSSQNEQETSSQQTQSANSAAQTETQRPVQVPSGWLSVSETQYPDTGAGERYLALSAGSVRNLTDYSSADIRGALAEGGLPFEIELNSTEPQVLIMHTHATECYAEADGMVSADNNGRSTDTSANMVAVGAVLADTLNAAGICTVQDATLHDYPSYNGSYGRSCATVEQWLAQYPSIKIVLDVHRDAIETDGVRVKPTALINGQKAAQLMIISGADDGTMNMPNFWQNLRFAAALEAAIEGNYDGLTRPVLFDYRNYNQQLTTGSLLLEIGGHGNTLEEAKYTAQLVGQAMAALLQNQG